MTASPTSCGPRQWSLCRSAGDHHGDDFKCPCGRSEFAGIVRTLDADRVVYSFAIRGERIELLGIVSMIARLSGKQTEARTLNYVRPLIQPALECLRREMLLRSQLDPANRISRRERDLP